MAETMDLLTQHDHLLELRGRLNEERVRIFKDVVREARTFVDEATHPGGADRDR